MQKPKNPVAPELSAHDEMPHGYGRNSGLFYVVLAVYTAGVLMSFVSGWTGQQHPEIVAETSNSLSDPLNAASGPDGGAL